MYHDSRTYGQFNDILSKGHFCRVDYRIDVYVEMLVAGLPLSPSPIATYKLEVHGRENIQIIFPYIM